MAITTDIDKTCLNTFKLHYAKTLIRYCARKFDWTPEFSRKVVHDALRFLALCAIPPTGTEDTGKAHIMVCSPIVDKVVDTILLNTPLLMWLERTIFNGVRLVHVPAYAHGVTDAAINNARYEFTVSLMQAAGFNIDREIWPERLPVDSSTCHCGNDLDDCLMYTLPKE